jgi:hypothetical protein
VYVGDDPLRFGFAGSSFPGFLSCFSGGAAAAFGKVLILNVVFFCFHIWSVLLDTQVSHRAIANATPQLS